MSRRRTLLRMCILHDPPKYTEHTRYVKNLGTELFGVEVRIVGKMVKIAPVGLNWTRATHVSVKEKV